MLLKDIKPGCRYAMVQFFNPSVRNTINEDGSIVEDAAATALEATWKSVSMVEAIEVGVSVPSYSRRGVRLRKLDVETGEPLLDDDGREQEIRVLAIVVVAPWDEFERAYHERADREAERAAEDKARRAREAARRQEQAARQWMEREFATAGEHIREVAEVLGIAEADIDLDATKRKLVGIRNPDGNPYLNGQRTAY